MNQVRDDAAHLGLCEIFFQTIAGTPCKWSKTQGLWVPATKCDWSLRGITKIYTTSIRKKNTFPSLRIPNISISVLQVIPSMVTIIRQLAGCTTWYSLFQTICPFDFIHQPPVYSYEWHPLPRFVYAFTKTHGGKSLYPDHYVFWIFAKKHRPQLALSCAWDVEPIVTDTTT